MAHANSLYFERRTASLLRRIGKVGPFVGASLNCVRHRCGNPRCRCARGEGHPSWRLTFKDKNQKTVSVYVPVGVCSGGTAQGGSPMGQELSVVQEARLRNLRCAGRARAALRARKAPRDRIGLGEHFRRMARRLFPPIDLVAAGSAGPPRPGSVRLFERGSGLDGYPDVRGAGGCSAADQVFAGH